MQDKPEGYVFGCPTKFKPEYCEQVIEYGKQGKSRAWIAATLDVSRATLDNWEAAHPDFLDAMTRAKQLEQLWWEDKGQENLNADRFQASMWSRSMAARFPNDWREVSRQEQSGPDKSPIQHNVTGDAIADLTRRLARLSPKEPTSGDAGPAE